MSDDGSQLLLPIRPDDHVHGPEDAAHTLVEYGDYECPDCGRLYGMLRDMQKKAGPRVRLVFRHYPYSGIHPHAQQAAEAAEAAGAQGKFWDMHRLLFERQNALTMKDLINYANELGLDVDRFKNDLKHGTYAERVREDFRAGVQNGVWSTPGLFLDGVRQNGPLDTGALQAALTA